MTTLTIYQIRMMLSEGDQLAFAEWLAEYERQVAELTLREAAEEVSKITEQYSITAKLLSEAKEWEDSNRYFGYASGSNRAAGLLRTLADSHSKLKSM